MGKIRLGKLALGFVGGCMGGFGFGLVGALALGAMLQGVKGKEVVEVLCLFAFVSTMCGPLAGMTGDGRLGALVGVAVVACVISLLEFGLPNYFMNLTRFGVIGAMSGAFAGHVGCKFHELAEPKRNACVMARLRTDSSLDCTQ